MSATATEKATAATSATIDELFHEAMRSYEKALKWGIQLQEESVNLWKDLLTKLASPEEFQAKLASMTADAFRQARRCMEEYVETFNRTSNQAIDLFGARCAAPRAGSDRTEGRYTRDYCGFDEVTLHPDGTVEFWDCFINGFVRTRHPSNKQLDTLPAADAEKIRRHLEEDYAQLFQAWLSR